jgi:hypothetical protein
MAQIAKSANSELDRNLSTMIIIGWQETCCQRAAGNTLEENLGARHLLSYRTLTESLYGFESTAG